MNETVSDHVLSRDALLCAYDALLQSMSSRAPLKLTFLEALTNRIVAHYGGVPTPEEAESAGVSHAEIRCFIAGLLGVPPHCVDWELTGTDGRAVAMLGIERALGRYV